MVYSPASMLGLKQIAVWVFSREIQRKQCKKQREKEQNRKDLYKFVEEGVKCSQTLPRSHTPKQP